MKVETSRFGEVDIPEESMITFPEGLPGFEGKRFFLVHSDENPMIHWLQSATQPQVAVMLMDPLLLDPNYEIEPRANELQPIAPGDPWEESVLIRVIVRRGPTDAELYVNKFAPVLFNVEERLAMQLPLVGSPYGLRETWPDAEATKALESAKAAEATKASE